MIKKYIKVVKYMYIDENVIFVMWLRKLRGWILLFNILI